MRRGILFIVITLFVIGVWGIRYSFKKIHHSIDALEVQFAYPVLSISPANYDDWESGFIGNHIYYRLIPDENRPYLPHVTKSIAISCFMPASSQIDNKCKEVKISFKPEQFTDCMGHVYATSDLRHEFEAILNLNGWVVPQWRRCDDGPDTICVTGKYVPDQLRRMQGVNFRFGWSKSSANDARYGAGPYCLTKTKAINDNLYSGSLLPRSANEFYPVIKFHTSQSKNDQFTLAIYGSKSLLATNRKNIQVHTPLAYYVVTNPSLGKYDLPWNTRESKKIIHDVLTEKDVFFAETPQFVKFAPTGQADIIKYKKSYKNRLTFAIPDYLPECKKLAFTLNSRWKNGTRAKATCTDIVSFVDKNVVRSKKGWDGFFVGVSAADPSHDSILYQYFTPTSSGSWTYNYPEPANLFYLAGIGQSMVTVDSKKICNIKPNQLGLSDLFVTDLLPCGEN